MMSRENGVVAHEFILKPLDIFTSPDGPWLNEYGMGVQAILYSQHVLQEAKANDWGSNIVDMWDKRIASLQMEHNIPEKALPILEKQFDIAINMQRRAMEQGETTGVQQKQLVRV